MNKTAVEWLESYLNNRLLHLTNNKIHIKEFVRTAKCAEIRKVLEIIEQAKAMEKKQIIEAGNICVNHLYFSEDKNSYICLSGEEFYKEKYILKTI